MKKRQTFTLLLALLIGLFITNGAFAEVQSTYSVTGNTLSVKIQADMDYNNVSFSSFHCTVRYPAAAGITLAVSNSNYTPVELYQTIADPTNAGYLLASFQFVAATPPPNSWTAGVEYTVFDCTITGGGPEYTFALVEDSPYYMYAYSYIEVDQGTDLTNYTDPFYPGASGLEITTEVISGNTWKYAQGPNYWLSTAATTDWFTATNWSNGVPTAEGNITINFGANQPIVSGDGECNDLNFAENSTVEIASDGTLTVNGDVTIVSGSSFNIKSTDAGTGSLIHSTPGIHGNVERFINGWDGSGDPGHFGWHEIGSPVAAQAIAPFQDLNELDDFFYWSETENVWVNRRETTGGNTINPAFGDTEFGVGKGYLVAYEFDQLKTFEGALNVADVPVSGLTNSDVDPYYSGYNLLGNPFSSALEWNNGDWALDNINGNIQLWDESGSAYVVLSANGIIPAMNGFMVYVGNGADGSLTIPATARVHDDQAWYKAGDNNQILLVASDLDHGMKQQSKIMFNENAASGGQFDMQYDAYFLPGYAPMFYSFENGGYYALNTYPEYNETMTIPFGFVKNGATNFSITLEESIDDVTCYLTDQKLNFTVNLSEVGEYSFVSAEGDDANRFVLKFGTVSINESLEAQSISVYSANKTLYLNPAENMGKTNVAIFDMLGREVMQREIMLDGQASLEVSNLSGNYIVRVLSAQDAVSVKVYIP